MKRSLNTLLAAAALAGACAPTDRGETIDSVRLAYDEEPPEPPDAIVLSHDLPETMACDEQRTVRVRLLNIGLPTWQMGTYKLGAADLGHFSGPQRIDLPVDVEINQEVELEFQLRAPGFETDESVSYRMLRLPSAWFGDVAERNIQVRCGGGGGSGGGGGGGAFNAQVVSTSFPTNVGCGETFDVAVTMRNTGTEDWRPEEGVALGAVGDDDPFAPSTRVPIGTTIPHNGGVWAFLMTFTAPPGPGDFDTDWRMVRDGGGPWFGQTHLQTIHVDCEDLVDAAEVSWDLEENVACSDHPTVNVHVHNTGTTTWRSYGNWQGYVLTLAPNSTPLADPFHAFPPNLAVPPGGSYTFPVTFHAPPTQGYYYFGFQLRNQDRHENFGPIVAAQLHATCNPDDARVAEETLATEVGCGRPYPVHIRMRNTGTAAWTRDAGYALANSYGTLQFLPPTTRVDLPQGLTVPSSGEVDFDFMLTAPFEANPNYLQSWRMVHGGNTALFGSGVSKTVNVHCAEEVADLIDFDLPESLGCDERYRAFIIFRNMGSAAWHDRFGFDLAAVGGTNPFGAPVVHIPIDIAVLPGQSHKFEFDMLGPLTAGPSHTAWQLRHNGVPFGPIVEQDVQLSCPALGARLVTAVATNRGGCDPEVEMRVTLRNVGLRTWGPGPGLWPDRFSLKEIGEPSPFTLVHEVALASTTLVRPGETHTFLVRMLREQEPSLRPKATWWQMLLTPTRPHGGPRADPRAFGKAARVRVPRACRRETEALAPSLEYETPQ